MRPERVLRAREPSRRLRRSLFRLSSVEKQGHTVENEENMNISASIIVHGVTLYATVRFHNI